MGLKTPLGLEGMVNKSFPPPIIGQLFRLFSSLILTFIGLTAITFIIGRVMPADPVLAIVGDRASREVYDAMHLQMGLDKPLIQQYLIYLYTFFNTIIC